MHTLFDTCAGQVSHFQAEGDVLGNSHMRKERVVLKHSVDRAFEWRALAHFLAVDENFPVRGFV